MRKPLIILMFCFGSFAAVSQSQATSFASVTIFSPVGAELAGDTKSNFIVDLDTHTANSDYAGVRTNRKPCFLNNCRTTEIASFNIIGGGYISDISVQAMPVDLFSRSGLDTMQATVFMTKPAFEKSGDPQSKKISVEAIINVADGQACGMYVSTAPYTVIINYN